MQRIALATAAALAVSATAAVAAGGWVKESQQVAPGKVFVVCNNAALGAQMNAEFHYGKYNFDTEVSGDLFPAKRDMKLHYRAKKPAAGAALFKAEPDWPDSEGYLGDAEIYEVRVSVDGRVVPAESDEVEWYEWAPADEGQWLRAVAGGRRAKFEFLGGNDKVLGAREIDLAPVKRAMDAAVAAGWTC
jgi:hypothetical protein